MSVLTDFAIRDVLHEFLQIASVRREFDRVGKWWYRLERDKEQEPMGLYRFRSLNWDRSANMPLEAEILIDYSRERANLVGSPDISYDGNRLALRERHDRRRYSISIRAQEFSWKEVDRLEGAASVGILNSTGSIVYYTRRGEVGGNLAVYAHRVGSPQRRDVEIFRQKDPRYWLGLSITRGREYVRVTSRGPSGSESWLGSLESNELHLTLVTPEMPGVYYSIESMRIPNESILVSTINDSNGSSIRLLRRVGAGWRSVESAAIAYRGTRHVEAILAIPNGFVAQTRSARELTVDAYRGFNGHGMATINRLASVALPGGLEILSLSDNQCPFVEIRTSNPIALPRTKRVWFGATVKRDQDSDQPIVRPESLHHCRVDLLRHRVGDGVTIPISLLLPNGGWAGARSCVAYVYGSYGVTVESGFSPEWASMLRLGLAVALVHVRGGGELGAAWHNAGRGEKKERAIFDYLEIVRMLSRFSGKRHSAIIGLGASAGGMIVAAAANIDPSAFRGIALIAPFISPYRTILSERGQQQSFDKSEYLGESKEAIECLRRISPLENIPSANFPSAYVALNERDQKIDRQDVELWIRRARKAGSTVRVEVRSSVYHEGPQGSAELDSGTRLLRWLTDVSDSN